MDQETRNARLNSDLAALQALQSQSSVLVIEPSGDPPDRYTITFRGRGLGRDVASGSEVGLVTEHQIDIRMPFAYPERPPDIRWLTPILHPNISFSGFLNLADVGLPWGEDVGLEVVCERLWDVARCAYLNLDKAANFSAKNWFEKECRHELPVDPRPLRDKGPVSTTNVIRYQRRGAQGMQIPALGAPSEVLIIDENTPVPLLPLQPRRRASNSDVLYIGPE